MENGDIVGGLRLPRRFAPRNDKRTGFGVFTGMIHLSLQLRRISASPQQRTRG